MIKNWKGLKSFIFFFIGLWITVLSIFFLIQQTEKAHQLAHVEEKQRSVIEKNLTVLEEAFNHAQQDIRYLAERIDVKSFEVDPEGNGAQRLTFLLGHFLATHLDYDHIRFIDLKGYELARVNQTNGVAFNVPEVLLQYKGDTSYMVQSQNLPRGEVYISDFDLNREHGVIERPFKTVARLVTPVFNLKNQKIGFIAVNLKGDQLFAKIKKNALMRNMKVTFFHKNDQNFFESIDQRSQLRDFLPELSSSIQSLSARWGHLQFKEQLHSYYRFSASDLSSKLITQESNGELSDLFPWLFVVSVSKEVLSQELLINRVHVGLFWGVVSLFIVGLSLLFTYLKSRKRHLEMMLERQISLFDGFFQNTPNAYLIKDLDGKVVYFNHVSRELFGKGEDIYQRSFADLELVEAEKFSEIDQQVIKSKQAVTFELKMDQMEWHVTTFPIFDAAKALVLTGCIVANQSKSLRKSEKSLNKKTQLLEAISHTQNQFMNIGTRKDSFDCLFRAVLSFTNSACGLIGEVYRDEGGILHLRPHAIKNMVWRKEVQAFQEFPIGESLDTSNIEGLFTEVILHEKSLILNDMDSDVHSFVMVEGEAPFTKFLGLPIFYQQKMIGVIGLANAENPYDHRVINLVTPLLELYGQMIHITQVQNEKQLILKQLANKENWLSTVINTAPDGILLVNDQGAITLANQSVNALFGYLEGELATKNIEQLFPDESFFKLALSPDENNLASQVESSLSGRIVQGLSKEGVLIPVEVRLSPMVKEVSETYMVCTVRDIRTRLETEKQLRQSQKMDAIGQLTGGIAHDFNNLLGIILGNLDLASLNLEDGDNREALKDIGKAREASERSAKLIQCLLAFARKQPLAPKVISLEESIHDILSLLHHALGSKVSLTIQLGEKVGLVEIDQQQFENALINLVVNAKDSIQDEGQVHIRLSTEVVDYNQSCTGGDKIKAGSYALVEVEDSGQGMTEGQKGRIFEPFYTTKKSGKGTGLGLAMVFGFMKQSKGFILVESELGRGATFKLYFPMVTTEKKAEDFKGEPVGKMTTAAKLLVVDDEKSLLESTVKLLRRAGYEVISAENADQAMEILQHQSFDLLFTDVMMPGKLNGIDLVLQARKRDPNLKFVVGTGYSEDLLDDPDLFWLREGLILKPYKEADLLDKIGYALAKTTANLGDSSV